jgi:hypothetical protein
MALLMGPVLSFRGCDDGKWNLTAIVVWDGDPGPLTVGTQSVAPEMLWKIKKQSAFRYTFALPIDPAEGNHDYTIAGKTNRIAVPGAGRAPTMAYASCNGFSSLKLMKSVKDANYLWKVLALRHGLAVENIESPPHVETTKPYHLLLLGGDQVYADSIWETIPELKSWLLMSWADGNKARIPASLRDKIASFYFELYRDRWSQPEVARVMACVPSLAMWDDHDLIDGWGSYPVERQDCAMFDALWAGAAKAFSVFQQHLKATELRPGTIGSPAAGWWQFPETQKDRSGAFSFACRVGPVVIVAIDMRSQRTAETQVVSKPHWEEIYNWLDRLPPDVSHLLVMSSIPVVYPGFDTLERLLGFIPGHQDLEDDLRDHWNSIPHKGERVRMVHKLLDVKDVRVTLLSGDVHVAALGLLESERKDQAESVINQLIASGIVHPGPGAAIIFALQHLLDSTDMIERGITGRMVEFPGNQAKFVGSRNCLSIEPDQIDEGDVAHPRLWCNWLVEGQKFPLTKVIHPVPR